MITPRMIPPVFRSWDSSSVIILNSATACCSCGVASAKRVLVVQLLNPAFRGNDNAFDGWLDMDGQLLELVVWRTI